MGRPLATGYRPDVFTRVTTDAQGRTRQGQLIGREVRPEDAQRPLHLPLLRAACDGSGSCCSQYLQVPASTEDRDRIVELIGPTWRDRPTADLFGPAPAPAPAELLNIADIDGRCAFQEDDGGCAVHAAGGPMAKPQPCLAYPAVLIVCGEEWHASLRTECACLARSALTGVPLSAEPQPWVDLRQMLLRVWTVPDEVRIDEAQSVPRAAYVAWMRRTLARMAQTFDPMPQLIEAATELGLEVALPPPADWLQDVASRAAAQRADAEGRSAGSGYRVAGEWGATVAEAIAGGADVTWSASRGRAQHHGRVLAAVATAQLHGHALLQAETLRWGLLELIRVLWLATASEAVSPASEADPRFESVTTWLFLFGHVLE